MHYPPPNTPTRHAVSARFHVYSSCLKFRAPILRRTFEQHHLFRMDPYSISHLILACCSRLMAPFKCHPDCFRTFSSQRGLTQHRSSCLVYRLAQAERMARAHSTFDVDDVPPNKRVRVGAHESEVHVVISPEVCNSHAF